VGDCHYGSGNHRTAKRLPLYKTFLEFAGIEPERLYLKWISASEGSIFTEVVKEFTETLRAMPPMKERLKRPGVQR
jgi:F420-non-reducing hydrogenase iron-sulfur subunit